jgi:hypothetical protein
LACESPPEGIQPFAIARAAVGGTITGRTDPSFILLQAPDSGGRGFDRWLVYGPDLAQAPVITGVVYASGGSGCSGNDLTAVNGRDWGTGFSVYLRTEVRDSGAGTVLQDGGSIRYRVTPSVTYALQPTALPGIADGTATSRASLSSAVGSWTLNDQFGAGMSVDVAGSGTLELRYRGCSLHGNLRVADGGLYAVTAALDPASCTGSQWSGYTYEGVALVYPLASGGWQMLFALSTNNGVDGDNMVALGRR